MFILLAIVIGVVGMLSVYFIGHLRGIHPGLWVLLRNVFILFGFVALYFSLRSWGYRGDYTFLVIVAFLFVIGQIMQYRIKSDLDAGGRKMRQQQFQKILQKSLQIPDTEKNQVTQKIEQNPTNVQQSSFFQKLLDKIPAWWRVLTYSFGGFLMLFYVVKKYGQQGFDALRERRIFLWLLATIFLLVFFFGMSKVGSKGRFFYKTTPWEFFKITLIVIMAGYLSFPNVLDSLRKFHIGLHGLQLPGAPLITIGPLFIIFIIPQLMFVLLGDFGQIILYGGLSIVMIFAATRKWIYLISGIVVTIVATKLLLTFGSTLLPGSRFARFILWNNLWDYAAFANHDAWWNAAFQFVNALFAMHAGGFWGVGLGLGYPTNIPLVISDFIYAAITEELGFIGAVSVILFYLLLFLAGLKLAQKCKDEFTRLLAIGFSAMLAIQAFVNIGGVIMLVPMTGITLPFISRGGFSLVVCLTMVGFLMALSHRSALQQEND